MMEMKMTQPNRPPIAGFPPEGARDTTRKQMVDAMLRPEGADSLLGDRLASLASEGDYSESYDEEDIAAAADTLTALMSAEDMDQKMYAVGAKTNHGHYSTGGVEAWDLIHDADLNFDEGNVIKYVARHRRKDGIKDLKKAMTYLKALALHAYGEEI
jgi:hypothetical protein